MERQSRERERENILCENESHGFVSFRFCLLHHLFIFYRPLECPPFYMQNMVMIYSSCHGNIIYRERKERGFLNIHYRPVSKSHLILEMALMLIKQGVPS